MFHVIRTTLSSSSPKLHSLQNHQTWLFVKFTFSTSSLRSKGNSFAASYLIDTCGFSPQRAASASKNLNFETKEKPDLVIQFFKNHGFSQTQALSVIRSNPRFLLYDPEKSLKPKIEFFMSKGFSECDVPRIIARCPRILARSLKKQIIPWFDFFDNMFQSKVKLMKTIKRCSGIRFEHPRNLEPKIKLLREVGVPETHIVSSEKVQEVKDLKFDPLKLQFVVAVHVKLSIARSTWARREGIYRKWGWTDDDISSAFRFFPWCMSTSDDKIEATMDFLVNRLGYESSDIAKCPVVLSFSLEKRTIPRGSVIQFLLSKSLVNKPKLSSILTCNEKAFFDKFVYCHENEAGELLKLYQAKLTLAG